MTQYLYILLSLRIVTVTRDTTQYVLTTTRTRTRKKKKWLACQPNIFKTTGLDK